MMENDFLLFESKVVHALKTVYDPELPVNIYDLGLIYQIETKDTDNHKDVRIVMTLTSPNCPIAEEMPGRVREAVLGVEGAGQVTVELTFEPPWSEDFMSDAAKLEMGLI